LTAVPIGQMPVLQVACCRRSWRRTGCEFALESPVEGCRVGLAILGLPPAW
jgi:hypothetical protein